MKSLLLVFLTVIFTLTLQAGADGGYLFATFRGEGTPMTEQIYFMVSEDGQKWDALNGGEPVLVSSLGEKGVRDPYIIRAHDNDGFYLIATDLSINLNPDWGRAVNAGSHNIVIWESKDLVNWSEPRLVKVAPDEAGCTWAPEVIYDEERGEYMAFWASTTGEGDSRKHRIWAAYTKDFISFGKPFIYIEKPTTVIDTTIVRDGGMYYRFTKDEKYKAITLEKSEDLMRGWQDIEAFSLGKMKGYEGPACFKLKGTDKWCLLIDWYAKGKGYQAYVTDDLGSGDFTAMKPMNFPFHPVRHGTVIPVSAEEMAGLKSKWAFPNIEAVSPQVKPINMVVDRDLGTIELPVLPDTDLSKLDPGFVAGFDEIVSPAGVQDFSKGAVPYQVGARTFEVTAIKHHNPVLAGYYADPDVLYSEQTGKFYIYPTSDGFDGWSGTYFKTFSSTDLVNWKDEGVILDLLRDVDWANRNAWAPCIIEKKEGDLYRYFYYFTAAQKIGVAVAHSPTGPFRDSGKPLVDFLPEGVGGGQQIDPEVFHDPVSGNDYLYWGNGYLAVALLNRDMTSIDKSTIQVMTPDPTFREGATVFYRDGWYYFLFSEDDTRSPNYRVRYAMSKSPIGPLTIPEDNLVIARRDEEGIYGTGHNSVLQIPGKDEWYIVYHRFNYPKGITMGDSAGFHREVCIDKMEFDANGLILQVIPTHEGIEPVVQGD